MVVIQVNVPGDDQSSTYPIRIAPGALKAIIDAGAAGNALVDELGLSGQVVVATNPTLAALYGERLVRVLQRASLVTMPDGEQYKNLKTVQSLYEQFIGAGLDRKGTVLALGGGVVGDTVGFAAATYMRGVRFVQVPTSLLSMVDSSVGGKVGVDLPQGKNLVGAFKQPAAVLIDPDVLTTLPEREWRCGMAEVIKHTLLAGESLDDLEMLVNRSRSDWTTIQNAVQVKVDVVQRDPYEQNIRAHLNLGHTFAHAIERVSNYAWPHGEAVAAGLVAAVHLSAALGYCDPNLSTYVEKALQVVGLPIRFGAEFDAEALYSAMGTDKKWQSGQSRFVLLRGIGQPFVAIDVPKSEVIRILEELQ